MGAAKGSLANAVGSMYVQEYFKEDAKAAALEMVADIRAEFNQVRKKGKTAMKSDQIGAFFNI